MRDLGLNKEISVIENSYAILDHSVYETFFKNLTDNRVNQTKKLIKLI